MFIYYPVFFPFLFYILHMQLIKIRVSTLPSYSDCPRRAAARSWRSIIESSGFSLRSLPNSIGAAIGTGIHDGAAYIMECKRDETEYTVSNAEELSIVSLRKNISDGIVWDKTTGNTNTAEKQIIRIIGLFAVSHAPNIKPQLVEESRSAAIADGFELSGHPDVETATADIRDWKQGTVKRPYHSQLGGYSLLRRSQGGTRPSALAKDFFKRVPLDKPQPPVETTLYDVDSAERAAWAIVGHIMRDIKNFIKSGDPWCFACNPMSMLCSDKFCCAWGTSFCELGGR